MMDSGQFRSALNCLRDSQNLPWQDALGKHRVDVDLNGLCEVLVAGHDFADRIEALESALGPLFAAARGLTHGTDWNKGTHAKLYRQKLIEALQLASATLNRSHGDDYCGIVVVPEGDDNG
jgi:hypothetical protein